MTHCVKKEVVKLSYFAYIHLLRKVPIKDALLNVLKPELVVPSSWGKISQLLTFLRFIIDCVHRRDDQP